MSKTYIEKYKEFKVQLLNELYEGSTEEFRRRLFLFPTDKLPYPVRIPLWMMYEYPDNPNFNLSDKEKVAMSIVIHFTQAHNGTGYMECSGNVENALRIHVPEAKELLQKLLDKNLVIKYKLPPEACYGHKRNTGWAVNVEYVHEVLSKYGTDIWL